MARYFIPSLAFLAAPAAAALFPECANGPLANNTVCNTSASVSDRARGMVNELILAEKLNLTGNTSPYVPRLELYSYQWWQEALHGVAQSLGVKFSDKGDYSYATSFPQPILMGAAFDDQLFYDVASVIPTEARAFNHADRSGLDFWTPNINPFKDPRWGRGLETPGEDPHHLHLYVKSLISRLQGDQDTLKLAASSSGYVALAFITGQYGPKPYPIKQLVAYERVFNISVGQTKMATLNLTLGSLARYDDQAIYTGEYAVMIDLEPDGNMMWNLTVVGDVGVLEEWPQQPAVQNKGVMEMF